MNIKSVRNSNIELLRIILMFMIVIHHLLIHATDLKLLDSGLAPVTNHIYIQTFINSFFVIGVNTFVFISGYYGIKFNFNTLISFIAQAFFYSVVISALFFFIEPETFSYKNLIKSLFPISSGLWWYITVYVVIYIISPLLNAGIRELTAAKFQFILFILFFFNSVGGFLLNPDGLWIHNGYSFFSFVFLYLLGRYFSAHYQKNIRSMKYLLLYGASTVIVFSLVWFLISVNQEHLAGRIFSYNNPLLILSSIFFFFAFKGFNFKNGFINKIAPLTLGVYMLDDHILVRSWLTELFKKMSFDYHGRYINYYLLLIFFGIIIFLSCLFIDYLRRRFFNPLLNIIYNQLTVIKLNNALNEARTHGE